MKDYEDGKPQASIISSDTDGEKLPDDDADRIVIADENCPWCGGELTGKRVRPTLVRFTCLNCGRYYHESIEG